MHFNGCSINAHIAIYSEMHSISDASYKLIELWGCSASIYYNIVENNYYTHHMNRSLECRNLEAGN